MQDVTPEQAIADYALDFRIETLSAADLAHLKLIVLDTIAVGVGARLRGHDAGARVEALFAPPVTGRASATVWASGGRSDPERAALVNGTDAEILDFQEVMIDGRNNGHAAVVILPALLALAEVAGSDGASFLSAFAAGLEINRAILRALGRGHREAGRGVRTTALGPPIAAAAAGAVLLGLDHSGVMTAIGHAAGALPAGLLATMAPSDGDFAQDKDVAVGLSAQHGVMSARMAGAGVSATRAAISGARGVFATFAHDTGAAFEAPRVGACHVQAYALKPYPANFGTQCAVAAVLDLRDQIALAEIEAIVVEVKSSSATSLSSRDIGNGLTARFSLPYAVASALVRGRSVLADFEGSAIEDRVVLGLMETVELIASAAFEDEHHSTGAFPAKVSIRTSAGGVERVVRDPWAGLSAEAAQSRVVDKVGSLLSPGWQDQRVGQLVEGVAALERAPSLAGLLGALQNP